MKNEKTKFSIPKINMQKYQAPDNELTSICEDASEFSFVESSFEIDSYV